MLVLATAQNNAGREFDKLLPLPPRTFILLQTESLHVFSVPLVVPEQMLANHIFTDHQRQQFSDGDIYRL